MISTPPPGDDEHAEAQRLLQAVIETSQTIALRRRRIELQLLKAKSELETRAQDQAQLLSMMHATLDASPDGVLVVDPSGELLAFNSKFVEMWHIPPDLMARRHAEDIRQHCASQAIQPELLAGLVPQQAIGAYEEVTLLDGRVFERHVTRTTSNQHTGIVVHWQDITRHKLVDAKKNRMTHILDGSLNEIYLFDRTTLRFVYANLGALNNLGYDMATLAHMAVHDVKPDYNRQSYLNLVRPLLEGETQLLTFETVQRRANGSRYNVQVHLQLDMENEQPLFMALVLDITERKHSERLIWNQANFDALTRLPNRSMLQDRLVHEMAKARRHDHKLAVMFIDLDKFKEINDTLGHDKGDQLLVIAAQRIQDCLRASDTVARMGGDEFVILLSEVQDGRVASGLAQNLLDALSLPFNLAGTRAEVSGSIGITIFPDDGDDGESLLRNADQAMYVSKSRGRNQYSYFTRELEVSAQRRMRLIGQLRQALKLGQLLLHFQPIIDTQSRQICRAEALLRWQHPELGLVASAEFIPLAEETGLIVEIGEWVFKEAVRWTRRWRDEYLPEFKMGINKSPMQFMRSGGDAKAWARHLDEMGLPGDCLILEVTESLLADPNSNVSQTLLDCRDAGMLIAIDDFGTGYSSLSYLKRFDIDYLKIDSSFIGNLTAGSSDLALSEAIIAMAKALGLKVVAEGVESELQLDLLTKAGCHFAQGYLFSWPLPPAEFEQLLVQQGRMLLQSGAR